MPDVKFSQFAAGTILNGLEEVVGLQGGVNKRFDVDLLKDFIVPGDIKFIKKPISSAEILAINDTPIVVAPAQGANKIIAPLRIFAYYNFNTIAYDTNTTFQIGPGSMFVQSLTGIISGTEDSFSTWTPISNAQLSGTLSGIINTPFNIWSTGGNPTSGNGSLQIHMYYMVIDIS